MDQQIQFQYDNLWTTQDLCRLFGKTPMTIFSWRHAKDLPTIIIPGGFKRTVRFVPKDVLTWARDNKIEVDRLAASEITPIQKPVTLPRYRLKALA
jgi:hypothetical protein